MKFREDQKGFSLVELIVVVGIVSIVAGLSINLISHIASANAEKVVQYVSAAMSKVQVNAMKKSPDEKPYLYVYSVGGEYYYIISTESSYNAATMGTNGSPLGSGVKIYKDTVSAGTLVTDSNPIKISYKKDGSFIDDVVDSIHIKGKHSYMIKLTKNTGKHFVSNE